MLSYVLYCYSTMTLGIHLLDKWKKHLDKSDQIKAEEVIDKVSQANADKSPKIQVLHDKNHTIGSASCSTSIVKL